MLKANQQLLYQDTNQQLMKLRQVEISYFSNYFTTLSIQATILCGFASSSLVQTFGMIADVDSTFKAWYWYASAFAIAVSLHCFLVSSVVSVYGPGLALRGPLGSMLRCINGYIAEQRGILFTFILACVAVGNAATANYWLVMDFENAALSTGIMIVLCFYWYHVCLRIYNRFSFAEQTPVRWQPTETEKILEEYSGPMYPAPPIDMQQHAVKKDSPHVNKYSRACADVEDLRDSLIGSTYVLPEGSGLKSERGSESSNSTLRESFSSTVLYGLKLIGLHRGEGDMSHRTSMHSVVANDRPSFTSRSSYTSLQSAIYSDLTTSRDMSYKEGYLSKMVITTSLSDHEYTRYYFVASQGRIWYYPDKNAYDIAPEQPLKSRPIILDQFTVGISPKSPPYELKLSRTLRSHLKVVNSNGAAGTVTWLLRCDCAEDLLVWFDVFSMYAKDTE